MLWFTIASILFLLDFVHLAIAQGSNALVARSSAPSIPTPISVAPSQYWEGDDGPWSSFTLQVGTPAQDIRIFISTRSEVSMVVLDGIGCVVGDSVCANARGGLFNMNTSSTWRPNGFWQLGNERNLGIYANGYYGNDTITLGYQGSGGPTLQNQILANIGTEEIYVGMFAVNPKRTNYTGIAEQGQASYMTNLKEQKLIPSVSFGYTAGAPYRLKKVLGSLTLGGYDESRFVSNNMTFSFAPDNDRDIVVGIQSVVSTDQDGTTHDLLPTGINAYIDSTVPQIWLPLDVCKAFEKAFGLTYDTDRLLYPVSSTLHEKLFAQNASITFTLGNSASGGKTIDITLPYSSFDLQAEPPFTPNATKYFPLQRAANETQYTLGRTFLQEAYLTVDWERGNFSVAQCLFDPDVSQQRLVAIKSVNATSTGQDDKGNSRNKMIGVGVGIAVAVAFLAGGIFAFIILRKRKRSRQEISATPGEENDEAERIRKGFAKAELDTNVEHARYEMGNHDGKPGGRAHEAWVDEKARYPGYHAELVGDGSRVELTGSHNGASELSNRERLRGPYHEMFDPSIPPVELPAHMPQELPASPFPPFSRSSNSHRSSQPASLPLSNGSSKPSPLHHSSGRRSKATTNRSAPSSQSSTSRYPSTRRHTSLWTPSAEDSRTPSSSDVSGQASPQEHEPFSPISPVGGYDSTDHLGLVSVVRGLTDPMRPPQALGRISGRDRKS